MKSEIGLIGLGVMGTSLARNIARNAYSISLYNRYVKGSEEGIAHKKIDQYKELSSAKGFEDLSAFVNSVQQPRKILLMLTAGAAVDQLISELELLLDSGDLIIDAGNSHYSDTERRIELLAKKKIFLLGLGVSGGEEGALKGPSLMLGGSTQAYGLVKDLLNKIAAKKSDEQPTAAYVGNGGSGHFVKIVHNGIEYAEMQLIAEFFQIMHQAMGLTYDQIAVVFEQWNQSDQKSYLLEITISILRTKDEQGYVIDRILDKGAHNGTGSWSLIAATELGQAASMMSSALFSRYTSSQKRCRTKLSALYESKNQRIELTLVDLMATYRFARLINHHQGFSLIHVASKEHRWDIDLAVVCRIWMEGCIIKSDLLYQLYPILKSHQLPLSDASIVKQIHMDRPHVEKLLSSLIPSDVPSLCISNAFEFLKQMVQEQSPAHLIQAQRDYFGAHGFQFKGDLTGDFHHYNWKN